MDTTQLPKATESIELSDSAANLRPKDLTQKTGVILRSHNLLGNGS